MATSVRNQSLKLVHLPTEVLVEISKHVPDKDLPAARLVCKKLCDAATPRFAKVNFTERNHVVSPYSIDALVDITEHPTFTKYVQAVGIYSARRTRISKDIYRDSTINEQDDRNDYLNAYVKTGRFGRRMERVFRNIKSRSNFVAINIYDNPGGEALDGNIYSTSSVYIAYRPVETLEQTVYAATRARCPVRCLNMDLFAYRDIKMNKELNAALYRILQSTPATLSLGLGSGCLCRISYASESRCLDLDGVAFEPLGAAPELPLHASYRWLQTKRIAHIKVAKITCFLPDRLRAFLTPSLTSLELSEMSVWAKHFDQNFWSRHIQIISALPGLQHCRLSSLRYCLRLDYHNFRDDNYELSLQLPGYGRYPCKTRTGFHLIFRNENSSVEVNGEDVCEKFEELACYVAAAEAQKVQKIVSAGCVDDSVVGIVDEIED